MTTSVGKPQQRVERRTRGHTFRKRFGQHFLSDAATCERILAALRLAPQDRVVEIGAGAGALTEGLLAQAGSVVAIEIDRDLARALASRLPGLRVVCADALRMRWRWLFALLAATEGRTRVFGNLPYNIATPLLALLFERAAEVCDFHFMVQAEVADRLVAEPRSKAYGRLSVLAQHHCEPQRLFDVPPACFTPPPKVQSSFIRLRATPKPTPCDTRALREVLRVCFGQRRKMLAGALRSLGCEPAALGLDARARAEDLTVRDFVAIADQYAAQQPTTGGK